MYRQFNRTTKRDGYFGHNSCICIDAPPSCQKSGASLTFFIRQATGFHRWAKLFELKFFLRETFLYMVKPGGQNHPHTQSICPVPVALIESPAALCYFF